MVEINPFRGWLLPLVSSQVLAIEHRSTKRMRNFLKEMKDSRGMTVMQKDVRRLVVHMSSEKGMVSLR